MLFSSYVRYLLVTYTIISMLLLFHFLFKLEPDCNCDKHGQFELKKSFNEKDLNQFKPNKKISKNIFLQNIKKRKKISQINNANISIKNYNTLPWIYVITPTHQRLVQRAELTRLLNTFLNVPNLHWIIVEDSNLKSDLVADIIQRYSRERSTHLNVATPDMYKRKSNETRWKKPRGVLQRNLGLLWLRQTFNDSGFFSYKKNRNNFSAGIKLNNRYLNSVVYFADDDNTYDLRLFEEMRYTNKVSVWPVGLVGYLRYESPIVEGHKVAGWFTYWKPNRTFALDMAGFAVNMKIILEKFDVSFSYSIKRGEQETYFLTKLGIVMDDLEPRADDCKKILVWHTQSLTPKLINEKKLLDMGLNGSNLNIEV